MTTDEIFMWLDQVAAGPTYDQTLRQELERRLRAYDEAVKDTAKSTIEATVIATTVTLNQVWKALGGHELTDADVTEISTALFTAMVNAGKRYKEKN